MHLQQHVFDRLHMNPLPLPEEKKALISRYLEENLASVSDRVIPSVFPDPEETFQQALLRKIREKGLSDAACCKKSGMNRRLLSRIRNDLHYQPSQKTALSFAVGLELSLSETEELLKKAGLSFSPESRFDLIIKYHIQQGSFDLYEVNRALFAFDQPLLGR